MSEDKHEKWNPSPKQFAAYRKREVELAVQNIRRGFDAELRECGPNRKRSDFSPFADTLHTTQTVFEAKRRIYLGFG